jgi:gliding motility-associated-like protein
MNIRFFFILIFGLLIALSKIDAQLKFFDYPDEGVPGSECPRSFINYGKNLYFFCENAQGKRQLAKFDGSSVSFIKNPSDGECSILNVSIESIEYKGNLYFFYNNTSGKVQLAKFDGNAIYLLDIPNAANFIEYDHFIIYDNNLYFWTYSRSLQKTQLLKYDGSSVSSINNVNGSDFGPAGRPVIWNSNLYFSYLTGPGILYLAKFDGTAITLINNPDFPGLGGGVDDDLFAYKSSLYFLYYQKNINKYLWAKYDGSSITLIENPDGGEFYWSAPFIVYDNIVYSRVTNTSLKKSQLAKLDGFKWSLITNPDAGQINSNDFKIYQGNLYFLYFDVTGVNRLAKYDGNAVTLINSPDPYTDIFLYNSIIYNNKLYFLYGYKLGSYDGNSIKSISSDTLSMCFYNYAVYNNNLYFALRRPRYLVRYIDTTQSCQITPIVSITASSEAVCSGTAVVFKAVSSNGGERPKYQWQKNGVKVGSNDFIYTDNGLKDGDSVTCRLTASGLCMSTTPVTSNAIKITVTSKQIPTISIQSSASSICSGSSVTFSAETIGGTSYQYQWKKNGVSVGTNVSIYKDNSLLDQDIITCTIVAGGKCISSEPVTSNAIKINVVPKLAASISISASSSSICLGTPVTFKATATRGTSYHYQWKKNGVIVETNTATYMDNSLQDQDSVTCTLVASGACVSTEPITSKAIRISVVPKQTAAIAIKAFSEIICPGTSVTFTATPTNGGSTPKYQWLKNGQPIGTDRPSFTDKTLRDSDKIQCLLQSSDPCTDHSAVNSNSITMKVITTNSPPVTLGNDTTLCTDSYRLNAPIGYKSYHWQDGSTNSTYLVKTSGTYAVQVTDACGRVFKSSIKVTLNAAPAFPLVTAMSVCEGESTLLKAPDGFNNYQWHASDNSLAGSTQELMITPALSTTYVATAQSPTGCTVQGTVTVTVKEKAMLHLGMDTSICKGDSLVLQASNDFISYYWSTGKTQPSITVSTPGTYSLKAQNSNGCYSYDTLTIDKINSLPAVYLAKQKWLCANTNLTLDAGNGFQSYHWNTGDVSQQITVSDTGLYAVTVLDQNGCKGSDQVHIATMRPQPYNFLQSDTAICQYSAINLEPATSFSSYLWSTGEHTKNINITRAGIYKLEVTDSFGCIGVSQIRVQEKECRTGIYIPNAFSPNNDGKNDIFKPEVFGGLSSYLLIVYDRWGNKVFESRNAMEGWNGRANNFDLGSGAYVWLCTYQLTGEDKKIEKGTVILVR